VARHRLKILNSSFQKDGPRHKRRPITQANKQLTTAICTGRANHLVATLDHALLVVAGRLVVGVDDGVGGHTIGVVRLGPGVDGVDI